MTEKQKNLFNFYMLGNLALLIFSSPETPKHRGRKDHSKGPGDMTKMATTPIYGRSPYKLTYHGKNLKIYIFNAMRPSAQCVAMLSAPLTIPKGFKLATPCGSFAPIDS